MVPPEEGIERFRDKEDEETPPPILPSASRGITLTEAEISTLRREGIAVDNDNNPTPENAMQSDDFFPTPSSLNFGFHGVDPWRQSGNFLVGGGNLKMTPIPGIQHIYPLDFFTKLYLMEETKIHPGQV